MEVVAVYKTGLSISQINGFFMVATCELLISFPPAIVSLLTTDPISMPLGSRKAVDKVASWESLRLFLILISRFTSAVFSEMLGVVIYVPQTGMWRSFVWMSLTLRYIPDYY